MRNEKDFELIDQYLAGDEQAFNELMRTHIPIAEKEISAQITKRQDIEDTLMEVFAKVAKELPKFRRESGFHHWLYQIASNAAKNVIKVQEREEIRRERYRLWSSLPYWITPLSLLLYQELSGLIQHLGKKMLSKHGPVHMKVYTFGKK
jgi:DNA-directed RNA polymerase specialized sigma24 family protein